MEERKIRVALVAHDGKKAEMVAWAMKHKAELSHFELCGTGHTAELVAQATGLPVNPFLPGPMGGDLEIGAMIAQRQIQMVFFFWDPLSAQPHDPDVKALMRIAAVYNIPFATNTSTADLLIRD